MSLCTKYHVFRWWSRCDTRQSTSSNNMLLCNIGGILIKAHCSSLQKSRMFDTCFFIFYLVFGVYSYVVWIIVIAIEEPCPTRTSTGTTIHLFLVQQLSIDIQVTVTIGIWIHGLDDIVSQLIVTILHLVAATVPKLQHIRTVVIVELHQVVYLICYVNMFITGFRIIIRCILIRLSDSIS